MSADPYRSAGYCRNPFAWDAGVDPGPFLDVGLGPAPLPGARLLVQVVGARGAGKTTTLQRWREAAPGPYHRVAPGWRSRWTPPPVAGSCYWDEVDRLAAPMLRRALAQAAAAHATVVAGTHVELTEVAAGSGLAVRTVALGPIAVADLARWADDRFDAAGLPGAAGPRPTAPELADVARRAGSSWRTAGDLLHAWAAGAVASRAADRRAVTLSR